MFFANLIKKRMKFFTIYDLKLMQIMGIFLGLVLAKLYPQILSVNIWWYLSGFFLIIIRIIYLFFIKKEK